MNKHVRNGDKTKFLFRINRQLKFPRHNAGKGFREFETPEHINKMKENIMPHQPLHSYQVLGPQSRNLYEIEKYVISNVLPK